MSKEFWDNKHKKGWPENLLGVDLKPSIFAEFAVKYLPKTGKILELGAGKGGDANFFKSLGYEVVAVDYSAEALRIAEENFQGIHFLNMDISKGLDFNDQEFEAVYSHMSLHYFDSAITRRVFKDINRVLKPNGVFATINNSLDDSEKDLEGFEEIEPGFYKNHPRGVYKRYFSVGAIEEFTKDLFETIFVDNQGSVAFKSHINNLVRFIGRKI